MNIHPFVFSNNRNYRIARHSVFWLTWILYYAFSSAVIRWQTFGFSKSFIEAFVEVAQSTPIDMCFCYFIIYYLFPDYLFKGKYISMLLFWLIGSIMTVFLYELNLYTVTPHIRSAFNMLPKENSNSDFWGVRNLWDMFSLFTQINMEGCVAASIKLGKLRYIKEQEIELLKNEKEKIKPHEERGLIQPAFLTDLLTRMEIIANEKPLVAAESIKKIRQLLLYILYENASSKVSLRKELTLLQEYIDLEKLTSEKTLNVNSSINASPAHETIAPFIVLPLVENAFKQVSSYQLNDPALNINIGLQNEIIEIKLDWNKPMETSTLVSGRNIILHNISKRLQLIYPQSHELKIMIETAKVFVHLSINLKKAIN